MRKARDLGAIRGKQTAALPGRDQKVVLFQRQHLIAGLVAMVSLIIFIESSFRGRLPRLIASVTIGLALVSALVLLYEFFWPIVALGVLLGGGYVIWENVRELL